MHIFLDDLETFRMAWKHSVWSRNFPDDLKTFRMVWKLSTWFMKKLSSEDEDEDVMKKLSNDIMIKVIL